MYSYSILGSSHAPLASKPLSRKTKSPKRVSDWGSPKSAVAGREGEVSRCLLCVMCCLLCGVYNSRGNLEVPCPWLRPQSLGNAGSWGFPYFGGLLRKMQERPRIPLTYLISGV
ncbi:hypothetical protein CCUS01_16699 [Colletotrichum cuscutae]|uniref:Uncharacterized protein n=1 Tax=Colletotrichum cuscutae TaxID=1209917 RepID=A0AAI9V8J3_9PEZI|nr:hypothetical protein CCUS01_16699 [Colletotrichum cuscutae]